MKKEKMNRRNAVKTVAMGASAAFIPLNTPKQIMRREQTPERKYSPFGVFVVLSRFEPR